MAAFTNLGIGSGLPLNTLVEAFLEAERVPTQVRLQNKEESLQVELSGVGALKSALSSFQSIAEKLSSDDAFSKQTINTSNDNISVVTNGFASNGEFDITVDRVAQGSRLKSDGFTSSSDVVGNGILTLTAGTTDGVVNTFDVSISATDDLSTIRDQINSNSDNFGVTANIINSDSGSFLVFNSSISGDLNSGSDNTLTITASDPSLASISTNNIIEESSQSAQISIDGNVIISESNVFKDAIEDVTITANKQTSTSSSPEDTTITIAQDTSNANDLINEFINGFNALADQLTGLGAPKLGRLAFDPNVRQVRQQLADVVLSSVSGADSVDSLQSLGIEFNKDGKLEISTFSSDTIKSGQERLDDALANNLNDVGSLFASTEGVSTQISSIIDNYIESDGVLTLRESSLNERLSEVDDEFSALQERLVDYENTLIKQFTALDSAVAGFNSTGDFVKSALANLSVNNDD